MSKSFFKMQNNNVSPLEVTFKWQKPAIFDQKTIYRSSVQFTLPIIILILDFTRCWSKPLWVGFWVRHFWSFIFITTNNLWYPNIVDISGALFRLSLKRVLEMSTIFESKKLNVERWQNVLRLLAAKFWNFIFGRV